MLILEESNLDLFHDKMPAFFYHFSLFFYHISHNKIDFDISKGIHMSPYIFLKKILCMSYGEVPRFYAVNLWSSFQQGCPIQSVILMP